MSPQQKDNATLWILRITVGCFATLFSIVTVIVGVIASEMRADIKVIMNERSGFIERVSAVERQAAENKTNVSTVWNLLMQHEKQPDHK